MNRIEIWNHVFLPDTFRLSSLLHQLLAEQSDLTAVERFARAHDGGELPDQERYYADLLPASSPKDGQQYAFNVNLDQCSGCKACVTACHSLNGLDENETWRDVGLLIGGTDLLPVMQHVTTACHHCLDPACAIGCPVNAYEKDPVTGIVKHLDDQCFGCQYCTMTCPYDVPKYHAEKGIVRKCDMCSDRLAVGEAPACVQACPHEAISIQLVDIAEVRQRCEPVVQTAPASTITGPTTIYESRRDPGSLQSEVAPELQHAHWPLIVMLVASQLSVGMFACLSMLFQGSPQAPAVSLVALVTGLASIVAATLHLGRPQFAFRAVLGVTHSWLSREIVAFGAFAGAGSLLMAATWWEVSPNVVMALSLATTVAGLVGVFCSAMIYVFTRRLFWSLTPTAMRFFLSTALLGSSATLLVVAANATANDLRNQIPVPAILCVVVILAAAMKLSYEAMFLRKSVSELPPQLQRSRMLLSGQLRSITITRFAFGVVGGIVFPTVLMLQSTADLSFIATALMLGVCLVGETCERYLFFVAVSPDRMPGGLQV